MPVSENAPTPQQRAACERAMDGLEAQADIWADEINLVLIIKNIGGVSRKLTDRMPPDVREGFINRQEANIDALVRQAYLEGFDRGGESRKAYDESRLAALSDQVVVPKSALDWLNGEAPDEDGKWFGECVPAANPISGMRARYWWRSKFRSMIPALSPPTPPQPSEDNGPDTNGGER